MFHHLKRNMAAGVVALTVLGGGAAAYATEAPAPSLAAEATAGAVGDRKLPTGARQRLIKLARHTVHGELVVKMGEEFHTVTYDRGQLQSVEGATLHVERPDGAKVDVTVGEGTEFRGVASAAELRAGDPVFVLSHDGEALVVAQRKNPKPANPKG